MRKPDRSSVHDKELLTVTITPGGLLAAHERALWPSLHELTGFKTHQTFVGGRIITPSRAEFEIDGKGIALNLLCPFPTDSSPPNLLRTARLSRVTESLKARARLLEILACKYGFGGLGPAESRQKVWRLSS